MQTRLNPRPLNTKLAHGASINLLPASSPFQGAASFGESSTNSFTDGLTSMSQGLRGLLDLHWRLSRALGLEGTSQVPVSASSQALDLPSSKESLRFWPALVVKQPCTLNFVLQDFAKLAAWEDRGYYSMRAATERAQRKLHKLQRHATEVLKQPVAAVLAAAAKAMGFADLNPTAATGIEIAVSRDDSAGEDGTAKGGKKKRGVGMSAAKGRLAKLLKESRDAQQQPEGAEPEDVAAAKRAAREAADAAAAAEDARLRAALEVRISCQNTPCIAMLELTCQRCEQILSQSQLL